MSEEGENEVGIIYEPAITSHWRNSFPKKSMLLGCQNLNPGEELVLVIKSYEQDIEVKGKNGRKDTVNMVRFEGCELPMCINITKATVLEGLYGALTTGWIGKPIQIYQGKAKEYGGKGMVDALCIREFKPSTGEDIGEYEDAINNSSTIEELKTAFTTSPKHLQGRLDKLKNKRYNELK